MHRARARWARGKRAARCAGKSTASEGATVCVWGGREAGAPSAGARDAGAVRGQARTATSAKAPLGAIATPEGLLNLAMVPTPSRKP